jgi:hypothetical protein
MIEFAAGIMVGGSIGAVIMGALVAQARDAALRRPDPSPLRAPAARPSGRSRGSGSQPPGSRLIRVRSPLAAVSGTGAMAGPSQRGQLH